MQSLQKLDKLKVLFFCFFSSIILSFNAAFALESDEKQPATINAESAVIDTQAHIATFKGNVQVKQGTTFIQAQKIIVYTDKQNKIEKSIATGTPAHYQTLPKSGQQLLQASADTIEYYPEKGDAILSGNSSVVQGQNSLKGPKIVYNAKQGSVKTIREFNDSKKSQRTTIVIGPSQTLNK